MQREEQESLFHVRVAGFDGPLEGLVSLVEHHDVCTDELAVADITARCLAHLQESDRIDLQEMSDFLRLATRLMLAKSQMLLPQLEAEPEVEENMADGKLVAGSAEMREVARILAGRQGQESFPLPPRPLPERPIEPRSPLLLRKAWDEMRARQGPGVVHVAVPTFVRLEVALSGLIRRLHSGAEISLKRILRGANRNDAVAHFLAVLELIRQRRGKVHQSSLFDDITVEWVDHGSEARSRAG